MVKMKIKQVEEKTVKEFSISIPYTVIQGIGWIATTSILWKFINNALSYRHTGMEEKVVVPIEIDRESVRNLLREIKRYKGLTIIDVKTGNGSGVVVIL